MSKIKNVPTIKEERVVDVRNAIEHRATWMYLLMDEAKKRGLEWDDFARKAIFRCGCFHGDNLKSKLKDSSDMIEFSKNFGKGVSEKVFEMETTELDETKYYIDFHYCPLVTAWQKQGCTRKEIEQLCDIGMDGDRGIASNFGDFELTIGKTIAQGNSVCQIKFDKKK